MCVEKLGATDCPQQFQRYSELTDQLKAFTDIRPKVIEDFITIRDTFPCDLLIYSVLEDFVSKRIYNEFELNSFFKCK